MSKPRTFPKRATKAHDKELTIANHCTTSVGFAELKKEKAKFKRNIEFSKNSTKKAMSIFEAKLA